jgi:DNA-binding NarL/FixJ family response regulator
MKSITVLLVEDHTIVREGLRVLIEAFGDIEIVGEAKTGREAVQMTSDLRPEIVVMDIAMPLLNGLQATRQILKILPTTKVLILSAHNDPEYLEGVLKAGAMGYVCKQASAGILITAIRELHKGKTFFGPFIIKRLRHDFRKSPDRVGFCRKSETKLTSRESELLQLIAEGMANKQIASELGISNKTVEKHRQHLMEKLDIHDVAGLTRLAIASGVIENSIQSTISQILSSGQDTAVPPVRVDAARPSTDTSAWPGTERIAHAGKPRLKRKAR